LTEHTRGLGKTPTANTLLTSDPNSKGKGALGAERARAQVRCPRKFKTGKMASALAMHRHGHAPVHISWPSEHIINHSQAPWARRGACCLACGARRQRMDAALCFVWAVLWSLRSAPATPQPTSLVPVPVLIDRPWRQVRRSCRCAGAGKWQARLARVDHKLVRCGWLSRPELGPCSRGRAGTQGTGSGH
jgi:hypothetical protein